MGGLDGHAAPSKGGQGRGEGGRRLPFGPFLGRLRRAAGRFKAWWMRRLMRGFRYGRKRVSRAYSEVASLAATVDNATTGGVLRRSTSEVKDYALYAAGATFSWADWIYQRRWAMYAVMFLGGSGLAYRRMRKISGYRDELTRKWGSKGQVVAGEGELDWLNQFARLYWPSFQKMRCAVIKETLELKSAREEVNSGKGTVKVKSVELTDINLGDIPPNLKAIKVYQTQRPEEEIMMDMLVKWDSEAEIKIGLNLLAGAGVPVKVSNISFTGIVRVLLRPLGTMLPCFGGATVSFVHPPYLDFDVGVVGGDLLSIPGLRDTVQDIVTDKLNDSMVWPKRTVVPMKVHPQTVMGLQWVLELPPQMSKDELEALKDYMPQYKGMDKDPEALKRERQEWEKALMNAVQKGDNGMSLMLAKAGSVKLTSVGGSLGAAPVKPNKKKSWFGKMNQAKKRADIEKASANEFRDK